MIDFLLRIRYFSFAAVVGLLVGLLILDRHVRYEQSLTAFFPEGDPAVRDYQRASDAFGNDNIVFITYDDPDLLTPEGLARVAELSKLVSPEQIPAVIDVQSLDQMPLFWEIDDRLADLMKLPDFARRLAVNAVRSSIESLSQPNSPFTIGGAFRTAEGEALARLRGQVTSHPLLEGTLVSESGTSTALVVQLKPMEEQEPAQTIDALRHASDGFAERHGLTRPALVGPPVLLADGYSAIEADGRRLAVVGMALIGLVTLSITQSLWWALVPMLAGWTVWMAAEAVMATLDLRLSLSGGPLVAQIIVLTMPAASHLAIRFRDEMRSEGNRRSAGRFTIDVVKVPILWTAITGAIGYGALLSSRVVPVFQFGLVLAACTLIASILTMVISPIAMQPPWPMEWPVRKGTTSKLAKLMNRLTVRVVERPAPLILAVVAIVLPLSLGAFRLDYESNYINAFKPTARVVQDYQFTESRLGGIGMVSIVLPAGDQIDPALLENQERLAVGIRQIQHDGQAAVSQVVGLATVLDPEGKLAALPPESEAEAIQTKLDLIDASPQSKFLKGFWTPQNANNPDSGWSRLVIRLSEAQPAWLKEETFRESLNLVDQAPAFHQADRPTYLTGLSYLLTQTTRGVIESSWTTFLWSAGGILLMLTIAFHGLRLASLALLPTLLSVAMVLGLTGWVGVKLDIATALVASVALGLSVDDTFHCLLQYRRLRLEGDSFETSLLSSYNVTGPGVLLSSLAVGIGFAVLRFSEFVPFSNFGTMVAIATLGSSLGNLVLLPACLSLGHHWSLQRSATATEAGEHAASASTEVREALGPRS